MNRKQKEATVSSIIQNFSACEGAFIVSVKMNAQKTQALKKKLRAAGGFMLVAKNTLLRRAALNSPAIQPLAGCFKNQIALIFAQKNAPFIAAIIKNSGYGNGISVHMSLLEGRTFEESRFEFIANIPSKETLYAQLCGVLQSPLASLAYVLKAASEKEKAE